MSVSEVDRFVADVKSNPALVEEGKKAGVSTFDHAVKFANSKGYGFTTEHAKEHVKAKVVAKGKELSDDDLNKVAGGGFNWGAAVSGFLGSADGSTVAEMF